MGAGASTRKGLFCPPGEVADWLPENSVSMIFFCFLAFVLSTWGSGGWAFKLHKINPEVTKPNYSKQIKLVKLLKRLEKPDQTIDIAPFKIRLSSDMRHVSHECASNDRVVKRTALFSDVPQGLKDYRMILCTAGFLKRESY